MASAFRKDPQAVKDYGFDLTAWLDGDAIVDATWDATPLGLTLSAASHTATVAMTWIAGGALGVRYRVSCHIVTAADREDDFAFDVLIKDR